MTTTGSCKGRGNQCIQFVRILCCKLLTNGKATTSFPKLRPCQEPNPGLRGVRQEFYHSATVAPDVTSRNNNKQVISTFNFGYPHLTLKEGPKVKYVNIKRFPANDFLQDGFTVQTSRTKKKRFISTFNFGYPHLTLKEGPKIKSVHIKRFPPNNFLQDGFTLQTSRTKRGRFISTFRFCYPRLTLKKGP